MNTLQFRKIILPAALAIFAMFFGAGNLVFPLALGAHSTHTSLPIVIIGFLISGIGLPALGLIATILCKGDYKEIIYTLGKRFGLVIALIIISLLGLIISNPRSCIVAHSTLSSYLPQNVFFTVGFKVVFYSLVFFAASQHTKVVQVIGKILSPIKISMILLVIGIGVFSGHLHQTHISHNSAAFYHALSTGYYTLDLLASFFFCNLVYRFVSQKIESYQLSSKKLITFSIVSTLLGMLLLGVVYLGFFYVANLHATVLRSANTASILATANQLLFNPTTAIAFNICVAVACYVTSVALTSITSTFFYENIFKQKISQTTCLIGTTLAAFTTSNFSFKEIAMIGNKVLGIIYLILIVLTVFKIGTKLFNRYKKSPKLKPAYKT